MATREPDRCGQRLVRARTRHHLLKLSCVIPATDRPASLPRCLDAVRGAQGPPEEVIVVTEPQGANQAVARNEGSRRAAGEVLVFLDADVLVHADAFARIRSAFAADPTLTALFGSYDDAPEAPGAVSGFRNLLHHHVHQQGRGVTGTFWTGLGAIRREAFQAAGGFDPDQATMEDVELGMRLSAQGALIRLDPVLQGTHLKRLSLGQMVRTDYLDRGLPWARVLLRSRRVPSLLNLGWRHRLSAIASVAIPAALAMRRPRAALLALLALVLLNAGLYRLIWLRRGPVEAAASVPLHALHHLVAVASVVTVGVEALRAPLLSSRAGVGPPERMS